MASVAKDPRNWTPGEDAIEYIAGADELLKKLDDLDTKYNLVNLYSKRQILRQDMCKMEEHGQKYSPKATKAREELLKQYEAAMDKYFIRVKNVSKTQVDDHIAKLELNLFTYQCELYENIQLSSDPTTDLSWTQDEKVQNLEMKISKLKQATESLVLTAEQTQPEIHELRNKITETEKKLTPEYAKLDSKLKHVQKEIAIKKRTHYILKNQLITAAIPDVIMTKVARARTLDIIKIIVNDAQLYKMATQWNTISADKRAAFCDGIIKKLNKKYCGDDQTDCSVLFETSNGPSPHCAMYRSDTNQIIIYDISDMDIEYLIRTIKHEYAHFMDFMYPNMGMIGQTLFMHSQNVEIDMTKQGKELEAQQRIYMTIPTEYSAFAIGDYNRGKIMNLVETYRQNARAAATLKSLLCTQKQK